ncbi:UNVERIFIED_ORG: hypothetical protein LHK14_06740 [Roseateles sp. XES5]|nr:hypothetical protein [Roseateles sp. XES5]
MAEIQSFDVYENVKTIAAGFPSEKGRDGGDSRECSHGLVWHRRRLARAGMQSPLREAGKPGGSRAPLIPGEARQFRRQGLRNFPANVTQKLTKAGK